MAGIEIRRPALRAVTASILLVISSVLPAQVERDRLVLGGAAGWDAVATRENVRFESGWNGGEEIVLREWTPPIEETTDLFLETEGGLFDAAGRYQVTENSATLLERGAHTGRASLFFDGTTSLELVPNSNDALVSANRQSGAFTIEFWIYPMSIRDGAQILEWRGTRFTSAGVPQRQELRVEFRDRRLRWSFDNLFARPDEGETTVALTSRQVTVPNTWQHHQLQFNARTGALVYRINGVPEAVRYANESGRETGVSWYLQTGSEREGGMRLGSRFVGLLDDFHIRTSAGDAPSLIPYDGRPGSITTDLIDMGAAGAVPERITAISDTPGNTAVELYYRLGNARLAWNATEALNAEWMRLPADGSVVNGISGRYIQIQARLFADAGRDVSPTLKEIQIAFQRVLPPEPPVYVEAEPVSEGVHLTWEPVRSKDVAGYRVYVGTHRGRYTGTDSVRSPIDVGLDTQLTVPSLEPGRPYVFAVESYDLYGQASTLSREREARAGESSE